MGGASLGGRAVLPRGLLASEGAPLPEVGAMRVLPWGSVSAGHGAVGTGSGWPAVLGDASSLGCSVVGGWGGAGGVLSHQGGTLSAEGATAAGMGDTGCPGGVTAAGTGQSCPGGGVAIGEGATAGRTGRSHCGGLSPCTVSPSGGGSTLSPIGDGVFPATQSTAGHQRGLRCHHHPGGSPRGPTPAARLCAQCTEHTDRALPGTAATKRPSSPTAAAPLQGENPTPGTGGAHRCFPEDAERFRCIGRAQDGCGWVQDGLRMGADGCRMGAGCRPDVTPRCVSPHSHELMAQECTRGRRRRRRREKTTPPRACGAGSLLSACSVCTAPNGPLALSGEPCGGDPCRVQCSRSTPQGAACCSARLPYASIHLGSQP